MADGYIPKELAPQAAEEAPQSKGRVDSRAAVEPFVIALVSAYPQLAGREAELIALAIAGLDGVSESQIHALAQANAEQVVSQIKDSLPAPQVAGEVPQQIAGLRDFIEDALPKALQAAEEHREFGTRDTMLPPAPAPETELTGPERFINPQKGRAIGDEW